MCSQYGKLRPTNSAEIGPVVWGTLCNFKGLSRLGSVTAWHSSSGRQPNFAALNRGRTLYLAGRPSRWASAHILVCSVMQHLWYVMHYVSSLSVRPTILWSPYGIGQTIYIFMLWFVLLSFFSSPNLSGRRLDVYHTSTHGVALV